MVLIKRLSWSISTILDFKIGYNFPFIYLGISISPRKLHLNLFNPMVTRVSNLTTLWKHQYISQASKVVLINSFLMTIPAYYLAVNPIPCTILDNLSSLPRRFFWWKGNTSGIPLVSWNRATFDKTEGSLAICNLRHLKIGFSVRVP